MESWTIVALSVAAFAIAFAVTRLLVGVLGARGLLDVPNARSSHETPTPRGGGLGILAAVVPAWIAIALLTGVGNGFGGWAAGIAFLVLAGVSFVDDRRPLPWRVRLAAQIVAVLAGLLMFAPALLYAPSTAAVVTVSLAGLIAAFVWIAFVNAFNFMDGIDGLAAQQAVTIAGGAALVFWWTDAHPAMIAFAATLAAASAGFLVWNRAPARIFMGDVGSVPLGLLLGFLLVALAAQGAWGAALALPAYFGADTALTMWRRFRNGEKLTEAHRVHAYQRAAGRDKAGHARVVARVVLANVAIVAIVGLGLWLGGPIGQVYTLIFAGIVILGLLRALERMAAARESA